MATSDATRSAAERLARAPRVGDRECAVSAAELGWPIERLTSLLAGAFTLLSLLLARIHHPRWRIMTGLIGTNLVLQAVTGWCPASLLMRRLGMRTAAQEALRQRPLA